MSNYPAPIGVAVSDDDTTIGTLFDRSTLSEPARDLWGVADDDFDIILRAEDLAIPSEPGLGIEVSGHLEIFGEEVRCEDPVGPEESDPITIPAIAEGVPSTCGPEEGVGRDRTRLGLFGARLEVFDGAVAPLPGRIPQFCLYPRLASVIWCDREVVEEIIDRPSRDLLLQAFGVGQESHSVFGILPSGYDAEP